VTVNFYIYFEQINDDDDDDLAFFFVHEATQIPTYGVSAELRVAIDRRHQNKTKQQQ